MGKDNKKAIIAGAGPAGLTAAATFLDETSVRPVVGAFGQNVGEWGRLIYPSKFIYIILLVQLVLSLKQNIETRYKRNN